MTDRDRSRHDPLEGEGDRVDIGPIDPDIALLELWLARELPAEEARAVKQRLVDDEAFFEKAAPIIRIWTMPVSFRALLERPEPKASERRVVTRTRASRLQHPVLAARPRRRARFLSTLGKGALKVFNIGTPIFVAVTISLVAYIHFEEKPRDLVTTVLDRAPLDEVQNGTTFETGPGETRTISLRGGSRVVLRHDSRFTYEYVPNSRSMLAALDGEAAMDLTREEGFMMVRTSSGRVLLTPGSYAVQCAPGCAAMLVTVGVGMANIRSDTAKTGLSLGSGDHGRMPKRGSPEKVIPGDGWPALAPPLAPPAPPPARSTPSSQAAMSRPQAGVAPSATRGRVR